MMSKMIQRRIVVVPFGVFAIIAMLDALLWHVDPLKIVRWRLDFYELYAHGEPHETGVRYLPGRYEFDLYTATIGSDGLRIVPDTMFTDCAIAIVGDSVTFGLGVNDYETYTNLLAQAYPAHWINAGIPGYNAENVADQIEYIPADGYIYLLFWNDAEPRAVYFGGEPYHPQPALLQYIHFAREAEANYDLNNLDNGLRRIVSRDDVLIVAFDGVLLSDYLSEHYPVIHLIPYYDSFISSTDPHPDAQGHQQIADAILPFIESFMTSICHAE